MAVTLKLEQEQLLRKAVDAGLAQNSEEALDQAFDGLRQRLPQAALETESTAVIVRRLASFGKRNGLSLGGSSVKELLRESRS